MNAPGSLPHGHTKADRRSLHLHRVALAAIGRQPDRRDLALQLVERWLAADVAPASKAWLEEWRTMLLDWDLDRIAAVVLDAERGQVLRQCSPLGPVLKPQERWAALREVNDALRVEYGGASA